MNMAYLERVVILIDMDCFYCQVEEKLDPNLKGKPLAVVQYNQWRGGGIIAVNYPARDRGVTRFMRGEDAKEKCPEIVLVKVPEIRGKADLSRYREAGKEVADVLQTFTPLLERASVDEAYLDVTTLVANRMNNGNGQISIDKLQNTFIMGCDTEHFINVVKENAEFSECNLKLCLGAIIAEEIRAEVFKQTGYRCSAGIAHNKILAKLVCGVHKPNKQTVLPHDAVHEYFQNLPLNKVRSLGGKFGKSLSEDLGITKMGELSNFSEKQLIEKFGKKNGSWLYDIARGINYDPVVTRLISKSIGCCKRFPGRTALQTHDVVQHWMNELAEEISERLEKDLEENRRRAKQMTINFAQGVNKESISSSRTHPLHSYSPTRIAKDSLEVVKRHCQKPDGSYNVTFLGISVSNFQEEKKLKDITSFFKKSMAIQEEKPVEEQQLVEDDDDIGNHSIYSASTEDLEEDPKSYIYFEDIYPEFVSSQPIESYQLTSKLRSVSKDKQELEMRRQPSRSFFNKYFDSTGTASCSSTSTPPDEKESDVEQAKFELTESATGVKRKATDNKILQYLQKCEEPNENYCEECKRNVPIEDILHHSDYHVAKKLQAEFNESSLKEERQVNRNIIKVKPKKSANNRSISDFFKPNN
ncbi:unnamed protein product [Phyllotreta striolata]|uniref:DNA polymerase eta n=1 Tax=Phyllotreta striolata TaxID=444603 RepID=A0A9N9TQC7_PHYSR|nr:unnamed protein product [Phyllotreta striolata]